jgi:hypothetical protein
MIISEASTTATNRNKLNSTLVFSLILTKCIGQADSARKDIKKFLKFLPSLYS